MKRCKTCGHESEDGIHSCEGFKLSEAFKKDDTEKPRMELLDPDFMVGVAQVLTFGANKYAANNWKKATPSDTERIKGAILRHLMAYMGGQKIDPETGLNHMYHISCNAMFLSYFDKHPSEHAAQGKFSL